MSNEIDLKTVMTCWNCKHCEWEVWLPTIKVRCKKKVPKAAPDKYCELYEHDGKANWKDTWKWSVQHQGHPYEDL